MDNNLLNDACVLIRKKLGGFTLPSSKDYINARVSITTILLFLCCLCSVSCSDQHSVSEEAQDYYKSGIVAYGAGNFQQSINYLNIYLAEAPWDIGARIYRADANYELRNYNESLRDFSYAKENINHFNDDKSYDSTLSYIYMRQGMIYARMDKYVEAISNFTDAIKIKPSCFNCYEGRGDSYKALGNIQNAISDYQAALDINNTVSANGTISLSRDDVERVERKLRAIK